MKLAIISDYLEENWHSMDLCSQMLLKYLQTEHTPDIQAIQVLPQFKKRLQHIPKIGKKHFAYNADRLLNRSWYYPQYLKNRLKEFDFYHIVDHSYAQLALVLPPEKTGVYCHDIDAFCSLIEPEKEPRPAWYQEMSRRILRGLQSCSIVFYSTEEVRKKIEHYQLVEQSKLVYAPYGISEEFQLINNDNLTLTSVTKIENKPFILHVGSCIPRKRIDILLEVFAKVRNIYPALQLVKVSGEWTKDQQQQIQDLDISQSITHLHGLERSTIASLYQKASAVLLTSEAEGFGLPIIEALACGAIVIASDIPVLREVGGQGVIYCPTNNISYWVETVIKVLSNPNFAPDQNMRLNQAQKYSWSNHTQIIAQSYLKLAGRENT